VSTEGIDRLNSSIDKARDNAENLKRDLANVTEGASGTQQQQSSIPDWISQEKSELDNLKSKIANEIPAAIETKNNAFNNEMGVVQNAVMGEIECFNLLEQKLSEIGESIAALDTFFSEMGSSSSAFDGLH
jgi:chromosome segregation ATPase